MKERVERVDALVAGTSMDKINAKIIEIVKMRLSRELQILVDVVMLILYGK